MEKIAVEFKKGVFHRHLVSQPIRREEQILTNASMNVYALLVVKERG